MNNHTNKAAFKCIESGETAKFIKIFLNSDYFNLLSSDENGNSLMLNAIKFKRIDIINILCRDEKLLHFNGKNGKPPSHGLRENIDSVLVKNLISRGLDINASDQKGNTTLHTLALLGRVKDYELLISLGAKPDIKNKNGVTPNSILKRILGKNKKVKSLTPE